MLVGPRFGCPPKFITFWTPQQTLLFFMESCGITDGTLDCCVPPSFFSFFTGCMRALHAAARTAFVTVPLASFSILGHFYFCCLFYFRSCWDSCVLRASTSLTKWRCMTIALEGVFFVKIHTEPSLSTFFFYTSFAFFQEMLPWLCLKRDMRGVTRALETEATSLFWKGCFIFLLTLNLLSMLMFLEAGGWSSYLATIPRMVWVLVRPGRTISTASGKGFWWIQRHGGWGK
ncbi:putative beta galactofuranosyl glycosyltransferase [Trypanosoma cruzi]|nr:putative beta galactofuranosyl glycosyltransferase [Trypanosoma cruzi]